MSNHIDKIKSGATTAFIDSANKSSAAYKADFISNDHTKGYIFRRDETYTFIIGSSNMTGKALSVNKEWNTKMVSTAEGEMYKNIQSAFDALWEDKALLISATG